MDVSFIARLKQACGLADDADFITDESDDDTYDPEEDPDITSLLFDSSESEEVPSDDSAAVDLQEVDLLDERNGCSDNDAPGTSIACSGMLISGDELPNTSVSTGRVKDVSMRSDHGNGTGEIRTRHRRRTYNNALRFIAAMNADMSGDEESDESDVESVADNIDVGAVVSSSKSNWRPRGSRRGRGQGISRSRDSGQGFGAADNEPRKDQPINADMSGDEESDESDVESVADNIDVGAAVSSSKSNWRPRGSRRGRGQGNSRSRGRGQRFGAADNEPRKDQPINADISDGANSQRQSEVQSVAENVDVGTAVSRSKSNWRSRGSRRGQGSSRSRGSGKGFRAAGNEPLKEQHMNTDFSDDDDGESQSEVEPVADDDVTPPRRKRTHVVARRRGGDHEQHSIPRNKVEERAKYYDARPIVGSRRFHAGPDAGATQNGIFYGPGVITDDDYMQPRDRTFPKLKVMPEGYGWRGRPRRQPKQFEFRPKRTPGVHHMKPEWTCSEMFEELWKECEILWRTSTNQKGREICGKTGAVFKEVTKVDTYAFLACKLWIDLFRKPTLRMYWCQVLDFCSPFIVRVRESTGMSHRRFQQIKLWTRLYNKDLASNTGLNNPQSLNFDVSHKAREYLDTMNRSCEWFMEPDRIISFDESMLEYTGIGGEKQTIRSKPIPTGLMFYAACTNKGYFLRTLLHAKQTLPYWQEMGVPFATVWSILSGALCPGMTNYLDTGRTLITDRAYTSVSLAYALAFRSTYFIGTTKRNLKCVPDCLIKQKTDGGATMTVNKSSKNSMSRGDTYFLHDNAGVVSFCAWQDSKVVPVLYTTETVEEMTVCKRLVKGGDRRGNEFERPLVLQEYDAGMGGVDVGDQHIAAQHRPTRCYVWYTPILFRSFDIFCNNVFCIKQAFGYQLPMLSVKLSIAYGMLQKAQKMAGTLNNVAAGIGNSENRAHNPFSVRAAERAPCASCGVRTTTGCELCERPCHLDECWKKLHDTDYKQT